MEWLTQQLRLMQGQRFGASSERTQVLSEQFSLFNEAEALADSEVAKPDLEQITYKRRKQVGNLDTIIPRMAAAAGVTKELKARDQIAWVGRMNAIRAQVEEMIGTDLIYC